MSHRTKKYQIGPISEQRAFEILRTPVITEKSTMASEHNKVIFKVAPDATKPEIKQAMEKVFDVEVVNVNTINVKGKEKVFRGQKGKRSGYKKAVISLAEGEMVDIGAGV